MRVMALLFGLGIFVAACSDDNQSKPPADRGVDIVVDYDAAWPDSGLDMATDAPAPDAPAADAAGDGPGSDAKPDGAKGEASVPPDKGNDIKLDAGNPLLWGYLSRSVTPVNDGVGNIHISVSQQMWPFPPIPVASRTIKRADLSKPGAKIKYQINATVATGTYVVSAWMDDNNNTWSPLAIAGPGDLVLSKAKTIKTGSVPQVDLVFDKLSKFGAADASAAGNVLKGNVTAKVTPSGDGRGRLFFSLHTKVPPAGAVMGSGTVLPGADLSSPYLSEAYYYDTIKPGKYYLYAWLDDNGNANTLLGNPKADKGDMIATKAVQVHVVNGQVSIANVVLDGLQK